MKRVIKMQRVLSIQQNTLLVPATAIIMFLPPLYYIINFFKMLNDKIMVFYFFILAVTGLLGLLSIWNKKMYNFGFFYKWSSLYIIMLTLNSIFIGNVSMSSILASILLIGILGIMLTFHWNEFHGTVVFYTISLVLFFKLCTSPDRVFSLGSNNYVSIVLILSNAFYYIPFELKNKSMEFVDLVPAIFSFYLSVLAGGRGGILCTMFFLVAIACVFLSKRISVKKRINRIFCAIIITLFVISFIAVGYRILLDWFMGLGSWTTKGTNSVIRLHLWEAYFLTSLDDPLYIMLGAPLAKIPIIMQFDGNCHNSFVQLHAFGGLLMFLMTIVLAISAVKSYFKENRYIFLSVLIAMVLRGMTDKFIFSQYGMPVMLFVLLYPSVERFKNMKRMENI